MKNLQVKVHVSKPCSENWEEMLPEEQGRFCLSCQKTVVDFTQKTETEIIAYFSKHGKTCGRFYDHQLLQPHELPQPFLQRWKSCLAAACLTLGTNLTLLSSSFAQTFTATVSTPTVQLREIKNESIVQSDGKLHIQGTVLDAVDEKPLPGVKIYIQGLPESQYQKGFEDGSVRKSGYQAYSTETDELGRFEMIIPVVELATFKQYLHFQLNEYFLQRVALEAIDQTQPFVQYLSKIEKVFPERENYATIRQGGGDVRFSLTYGRQKPYRTRAGVLLAYAFLPVSRLKASIRERFNNY